MKESGISWVGEIPKEWSVKKIKHISYVIGGNGFNVELQGLESGDYPFCKASDISNAGKYLDKAANYVTFDIVRDQHYNIIPKGAILFPKIGEAMKKNNRTICVLDCCVDNNCQAIVPFERNSGMFLYYILTCVNMGWFDNAGTIPCMNNRKFLNSKVPFPSIDEQQRIAEFLDRECGKIDGLKADIQAQIDTLEQYKRSVITEAVTHGLNPSAPMKDSGINYISEHPIHWSLRRLKYILNERNERSVTGTEELLSVSLYKGVIPSTEMTNRTMQADSLIGYKRVYKGDLVFNKLNPGMARFGCSDYDGITSPDFAVYIVNENYCNAKFLQYLLKTDFYVEKIKSVSMGVGDGFTRLYSNQLYEFFVALPPRDEVSIIINYLDNKCAEIEQIIADKESQIETLDGYKKSLIYEYVTGKKEVV